MPFDGCTWLITLDGDKTSYGPDEASEPRLRAFANSAIGKMRAKIEYRVTGDSVTVPCGWGGSIQAAALSITAISPP